VYTILNGTIRLVVLATGGYMEPNEYDLKEYWTWKAPGRPVWFVRMYRRYLGSDSRRRGGGGGDDDGDEGGVGPEDTSSKHRLPTATGVGCDGVEERSSEPPTRPPSPDHKEHLSDVAVAPAPGRMPMVRGAFRQPW
jgi:hypothetical protein